MKAVALTKLQKDILDTAVLMIQPFNVTWLAKAIRRPRRGVLNQIGILCGQGILIQSQAEGTYQFHDHAHLERAEKKMPEKKKTSIYKNLWRAISTGMQQLSPAEMLQNKVWAALKANEHVAAGLASDALALAFMQIDDFMADSIFRLCDEKWPEDTPVPILYRKAEFEFLKGNLIAARNITDQILSMKQVSQIEKIRTEILKDRILAQNDSQYPAETRLKQYVDTNTDADLIHDFIIQIVVCYQETGFISGARKLLESCQIKTPRNVTAAAEFDWLQGRFSLLNGNTKQALQYLQNALISIEKHINRFLAACIMLDIARVHGIRGNTIREGNCLRIVEHLIHRGKREYLHGKLTLYHLDQAFETGNLKDAGRIIYNVLQTFPFESGRFHMAVAAYGGLVLANRLGCITRSASYLDELIRLDRTIPGELLLRIHIALDDVLPQDNHQRVQLRHTIDQYVKQRRDFSGSDHHTEEYREITYSMAMFLRQSQRVCDLLLNEYRNANVRCPEKLEQARWLAERIRDQKRCTELKQLSTAQSAVHAEVRQTKYGCYDFFIDKFFNVHSWDQFHNAVQLFFSETFGIGSGIYLVNRENRWVWSDAWGEKPGLKEQRAIIRGVEQSGYPGNNRIVKANCWIGTGFPPMLKDRGFLCVKQDRSIPQDDPKAPVEEHIKRLITPIAIMRQVLLEQIYRPGARIAMREDHADRLIGISPQMQEVRNTIRQIADSPTTVHISGETGTGKELIAEAIHYCGSRKNHPFIPFNCSTSPETLIESELFGHRRGAFTGAVENRKGIFQIAQGGTVFLDEVADLPPIVQAKLLRVLQEKKVRPLGSDVDIAVNVRILSATHKQLGEEVQKGRFRSDLFYRLVVLHIQASPLRDRPEDISVLAEQFLEEAMRKIGLQDINFSQKAIRWLSLRYWPGNVRELQNLIEAAVNFTRSGGTIDTPDLKKWAKSTLTNPRGTLVEATEKYQTDLIRKTLEYYNCNITQSAERLGISRQTLLKKIKNMDLYEQDVL
jgi:two-component system, NtrC family, response regulator PilR